MATTKIKNAFLKLRKLSPRKVAKYASLIIGGIILLCVLLFIFLPDPFINTFLKDRITQSVRKEYPTYSLQLGDLHYSVWKNRLECDSIVLKTNDSTFTGSVGPFSISGISWMKILWQSDFNLNTLTSSVIDAQKIVLSFHDSQHEIRFDKLHISIPDSEMTADSIKYYSLIDDEQFFAKSQFRQTRFRFDVPKIKIIGLDCLALFQGNNYSARSINIYDVATDILVNMDKPYDNNSVNPQMPNEFISSMKGIIKVDSLNIINGRLNYSEKFSMRATPGIVTFKKVNVSASGISNNTNHPDTAVLHGEGVFMNSGTMKLDMAIPLASKDFSLRYSGSLSTMDVTVLNSFIEAGEHRRIKSGILHYATFNINVNSGQASGELRVKYENISIAVLNENTGSENGIFDRIASIFSEMFVIRGTNMPDENGLMKIGEIIYTRDPEDYFFQFLWFALRNGVGDVVGFPPPPRK